MGAKKTRQRAIAELMNGGLSPKMTEKLNSLHVARSTENVLTNLANAWLGREPVSQVNPWDALCNERSLTSYSLTIDKALWALYRIRVPEVLTESNSWEMIDGGSYTSTHKHPKTGKTVVSLQEANGWVFYSEQLNIAVNVIVHYDGEVAVFVAFNEDDRTLDEVADVIEETIEEPNPYRNEVCKFEGGGLTILRLKPEVISPYESGVEKAVNWLKTIADEKVRARLSEAGLPTRAGLLLEGPPGSGKTTLVRNLARELVTDTDDVTVIYVTTNEDPSSAFDVASMLSPALLIFEDVEGFFGSRGDYQFSEFLNALDGVDQSDGLMVLATTNDSSDFDNAVRRAGRIERRAVISGIHPDAHKAMIRRRFEREDDATVEQIIAVVQERTGDLNPAIIDSLCRHALMLGLTGSDIIDYARSEWEPSWEGSSYID